MTEKHDRQDGESYRNRKAFFDNLLTVYGRKPVLEALQQNDLSVYRLHLASSNKPASILEDIIQLAKAKGAELVYHDRAALARISRNGKQDQGVAVDLRCRGYRDYREFLQQSPLDRADIIALDRITNPQNLGMIIRSACAAGAHVLLPAKGCARLDALVIKASAGTLFHASLLRCHKLPEALGEFRKHGYTVNNLSASASKQINEISTAEPQVFVLGNETEGVSVEVATQCDQSVSIEMQNGVESLNVAVAASLLAFRGQL